MMEVLGFDFGEYRTEVCFRLDPSILPDISLLVFDRNTRALSRFAAPGSPLVFPAGERSKSWSAARRILCAALSAGLARDSVIAGVGGGMICDLAAFAASLYMRGCRLILYPTSLLAMVDAAIGGKSAVNLRGYKNMAGTFYPAEKVVIDVRFLASLPEKEYRSGLGEVIKTALLGDPQLLEMLCNRRESILARDPGIMEEVVRRCVAVKAGIVTRDLRESGQRAILNLGHTFAHAQEAESGYRMWSHGQAVAWGIAQAAALARRLGICDRDYEEEVRKLLLSYGFELETRRKAESIVKAMQVDKKKRGGKLRVVLQRGIGDTVVLEVEEHLILDTLRRRQGKLP